MPPTEGEVHSHTHKYRCVSQQVDEKIATERAVFPHEKLRLGASHVSTALANYFAVFVVRAAGRMMNGLRVWPRPRTG
ncbi:cobalt chelatase large subunit [Anopheles sinensis]|uniref:Cobalt chelatase large subunit n=1 Tax=Anopheles sinensis TaxID=74873 RepID=A0A084WAE5_ANOSI|nr:cobalt chelatase large subunit [Anopheles sinensis]